MSTIIIGELKQKVIALCDGTRSRRTVAKEIGCSHAHIQFYERRHPELNLKFLRLKHYNKEFKLSKPESEINDLLMQQW